MRKSWCIAAAVAAILAFPVPVHGQSFFEQLFGGFAPKPVARPAQGPVLRLGVPEPLSRGGDITRTEADEPRKPKSTGDDATDKSENGGQRQSMCVRTCDGYYWPIRYPSSRRDLPSDEAACRASCGTETKLYTRANPGVPAEDMRDEDGRTYGDSPTAFVYRKRLVDGCACRPMPWSDSEVARHERYALIEEERRIRVAEAEQMAKEAAAGKVAAATQPGPAAIAGQGRPTAEAVQTDNLVTAEIGPTGQVAGLSAADQLAAEAASKVPATSLGGTKKTGSKSAARRDPKPDPRQGVRLAVGAQGGARTGPRPKRGEVQPGVFALAVGQPKFRYPGD